MDSLSWKVRIRSTAKDRATAYVRKHQVDIGVPLQFDEEYDGVTALEHVLAALGADLVNGLCALAQRQRLSIDDAEAVVSGTLNNPLAHLGVVGEEGHPGLEKLAVTVYVSSIDPEEDVRRVWEETVRRSPLAQTLQRAVDLDLTLKTVI